MKSLWQWKKHDVANYLRLNFYWNELEFTTESLIKDIEKSKEDYYYFGYSDQVISKHLSDLEKEGYLTVRYISVKMEPNKNYFSSEKSKKRFGSKTVSVYKMVSRDKKIEEILK